MQPAHQSCHSSCIPRSRSAIGRSPRKRETGALCSSARVPLLVGTSSSLINPRTNGAFSHVSSSASQFAKLLLCARSPTARRTESGDQKAKAAAVNKTAAEKRASGAQNAKFSHLRHGIGHAASRVSLLRRVSPPSGPCRSAPE